ncbi:MAG: L,D-transpeptidase [Actinomycetota bacterium]|nr:L,D-transpeptidase [Actinomycetota bacterium]
MRRPILLALGLAALATAPVVLGFVAWPTPGARAAHLGPALTHKRVVKPARPAGSLVAWVVPGRRIAIRNAPSGRIVAWAGSRTEFGSPQSLPVVRKRADWLAVKTTELPNGRAGWVDPTAGGLRYSLARVSLAVDLSRRLLEVKRGTRVLRRIHVAVGRAGSSTPTGRFSITDKLPGSRYGSYFGCCILALSGHQPNLPPGWTGGDRLAIHGGSTTGAVSAGCLHAGEGDLDYLMRTVRLGTQVLIHD